VYLDLDGSNSVQMRYIRGDGANELVARIDGSNVVNWYLTDRQGNVRDIIDNSAASMDSITYTAFGDIATQTNSANLGRFAAQGRQFDTGTRLLQADWRFLNVLTGQWIQLDQSGFAAGDPNLYRDVGNNPINAADPSGLQLLQSPSPQQHLYPQFGTPSLQFGNPNYMGGYGANGGQANPNGFNPGGGPSLGMGSPSTGVHGAGGGIAGSFTPHPSNPVLAKLSEEIFVLKQRIAQLEREADSIRLQAELRAWRDSPPPTSFLILGYTAPVMAAEGPSPLVKGLVLVAFIGAAVYDAYNASTRVPRPLQFTDAENAAFKELFAKKAILEAQTKQLEAVYNAAESLALTNASVISPAAEARMRQRLKGLNCDELNELLRRVLDILERGGQGAPGLKVIQRRIELIREAMRAIDGCTVAPELQRRLPDPNQAGAPGGP
jgi:RHS repeat-associated protein